MFGSCGGNIRLYGLINKNYNLLKTIGSAGEHVIQDCVLIRQGRVAPLVGKCIGWFWKRVYQIGPGQP